MRYLAIFLLLSTCEAHAHKKQQIIELLNVAYMSDLLPNMVYNQIQKQNKQADENEISEKVKQRMDEVFYEQAIQVFDEQLTEADLETALTFFKSESNKKFKTASAATFHALLFDRLPKLIDEVLESYPAAQPKEEAEHEDLPQGKFEEEVIQSKLPVVVDIYGQHCPPCKRLAPIIAELAGQMQGLVKFVKMDINNHSQIADDLKITVVPTLLFYKDGKLLEKHIGFISKEDLKEKIAKHFTSK